VRTRLLLTLPAVLVVCLVATDRVHVRGSGSATAACKGFMNALYVQHDAQVAALYLSDDAKIVVRFAQHDQPDVYEAPAIRQLSDFARVASEVYDATRWPEGMGGPRVSRVKVSAGTPAAHCSMKSDWSDDHGDGGYDYFTLTARRQPLGWYISEVIDDQDGWGG